MEAWTFTLRGKLHHFPLIWYLLCKALPWIIIIDFLLQVHLARGDLLLTVQEMSESAKKKGGRKRQHAKDQDDDTEEALGVQRKLKKKIVKKNQKH